MSHLTLLLFVFGLGMRHGFDPDHLSVIDSLSCIHPSRLTGVWFALGHGLLVTLLAVGVGSIPVAAIEPYAPWALITLGIASLWRLRTPTHLSHRFARLLTGNPLLLGILFGMGFESATQLSALVLATTLNPLLVGSFFSAGMTVVDGIDGYLAARAGFGNKMGSPKAVHSARLLCVLSSIVSFGLGSAELFKLNFDKISLPLGVVLFAALIVLRVWSRSEEHGNFSRP